MSNNNIIKGFSKLDQEAKRQIVSGFVNDKERFLREISDLQHPDSQIQEKLNSFSENTIANFPLPFGVAPNFLINGKLYMMPMVIEESSVVAAASSAARFWSDRGGFRAEVIDTKKTGHISFLWKESPSELKDNFDLLKQQIIYGTAGISERMKKRGGGIQDITLVDLSDKLPHAYQLFFTFYTADSMGANFINSLLEKAADILETYFEHKENNGSIEILMSILSNYTPECRVKVETITSVEKLNTLNHKSSGNEFARRFVQAVEIARNDVYRAVTHNKGIFNGIDAVVMATGNDYRAVEAAGHAYAAKDGQYSSLTYADITEGEFLHGIELPISLGTVGGLTALHPLAKWSFDILGKPDAAELMQIAAAAGLANNFSALRSLVTSGIQKGHMKMHLENILSFMDATKYEREKVRNEFHNKVISHSEVEKFLAKLRKGK